MNHLLQKGVLAERHTRLKIVNRANKRAMESCKHVSYI